MKENEDKNIEQFADRLMKETSLESPSYNFTSKVMANIAAFNKSNVTIYTPVISKKGWALIFGGIIAIMLYLLMNGSSPAVSHSWLSDHGGKDFIKAFSFPTLFQYSRVTVNVVMASTIIIFIQIILLKNYLNKRLTK